MVQSRNQLSWILFLISLTVCALVNPGNFGTIDTTRRLQVARWMRLGEPPVHPDDVGFGLSGRGGVKYAWYGLGQSLVLLPFDAAVSAVVAPFARRLALDPEKRRQVTELLIAFLMQTCILTSVVFLARQVLLSFGFNAFAAAAGTLTLLFGTSALYYVQCAQENNLILLLALCAVWAVRQWQRTGSQAWPWMAGAACGFAILVRLTCLLEAAVILAFAVGTAGQARRFAVLFLSPVLAALVVDRWYHWSRFGELFGSYMGVLGRQYRPAGAPEAFPFGYPFQEGFFGALFAPAKSIFLFDPLLLVLILCIIHRRRLEGDLSRFLAWMSVLLFFYLALYATYFNYGGDVAWGDRFVTLPVHLLCLFAVPLLLGTRLRRPLRLLAWLLVVTAAGLQLLATTLPANVEVLQRERGYGKTVIVSRVINLSQVMLNNKDEQRFAGIPSRWRTLNYLPFQLRFRYPRMAVGAIVAWFALLAALPVLVWMAFLLSRRHRVSGSEAAVPLS